MNMISERVRHGFPAPVNSSARKLHRVSLALRRRTARLFPRETSTTAAPGGSRGKPNMFAQSWSLPGVAPVKAYRSEGEDSTMSSSATPTFLSADAPSEVDADVRQRISDPRDGAGDARGPADRFAEARKRGVEEDCVAFELRADDLLVRLESTR